MVHPYLILLATMPMCCNRKKYYLSCPLSALTTPSPNAFLLNHDVIPVVRRASTTLINSIIVHTYQTSMSFSTASSLCAQPCLLWPCCRSNCARATPTWLAIIRPNCIVILASQPHRVSHRVVTQVVLELLLLFCLMGLILKLLTDWNVNVLTIKPNMRLSCLVCKFYMI